MPLHHAAGAARAADAGGGLLFIRQAGTQAAMQALAAGAVEIIAKPEMRVKGFLEPPAGCLCEAKRAAAQYTCRSSTVCRCPVDVLFRSVARHAGHDATAVLLTGMCDNGARGLRDMLDARTHTIVQDEASSVVFDMSREAIRLGAVRAVVRSTTSPDACWKRVDVGIRCVNAT